MSIEKLEAVLKSREHLGDQASLDLRPYELTLGELREVASIFRSVEIRLGFVAAAFPGNRWPLSGFRMPRTSSPRPPRVVNTTDADKNV